MRFIVVLFCFVLLGFTSYAKEEPEHLYAQSAVLLDAENGRVLFEKDGNVQRAMASTTKVMTCILAMEYGNLNDVVTFSDYAVTQPKVHLGAESGSQFFLRDLLYSLMLESHNDSAVAIAEHIAGSVEEFAVLMNEKAKILGCTKTNFVTPNGLDGENENGNHVTTAAELALILKYCIMESPMKEEFLSITRERQYRFSDVISGKQYQCQNHNAFLDMMDGALTGKTGYTSKAGYCYVGALQNDGRTFVVALLACGWPNHKDYKWSDMKQLMEYAMENYDVKEIDFQTYLKEISVENSISECGGLYENAKIPTKIEWYDDEKSYPILLHREEKVIVDVVFVDQIQAPVKKGEKVGEISVMVDEKKIEVFDIVSDQMVYRKDFNWYLKKLSHIFFCEKYVKNN